MAYIAGMNVNLSVVWLAAMIVLLVVEGIVPGLVSIWFALGALAALISSMLGAPVWLQVVWFLLVSVVSLVLTRPLAKKYINSKTQPTNADACIGKEGIVAEDIDNIRGTGAVAVGGRMWTARALNDEMQIEAGEVVKIIRIEGVKLIVSQNEENGKN